MATGVTAVLMPPVIAPGHGSIVSCCPPSKAVAQTPAIWAQSAAGQPWGCCNAESPS